MLVYSLLLCVAVNGAAAAVGGDDWLTDPATQDFAEARIAATPTFAKRVAINLDLPPKDRWTQVASLYKKEAPAIIAYFEAYIPKWLFPYVEEIGADIQSYFPKDYAEEMSSLAPAMGLEVGTVVLMNLIYEIEHIGQACNTSNTTGPVPDCPPRAKSKQPGMCTSAMVPDAAGTMFHARNLDWNIPAPLRPLMVDVDYTKGGKVLFTGSQPVGFIGVMHASRHNGWSFSLNARDKGGDILGNIVQALLRHSLTPTQHARRVLETTADFGRAVEALATGPLINEAYFNVAGASPNQAAVVSRGRDRAVDVWHLSPPHAEGGVAKGAPAPFFLLQTNYDHWEPAPSYDDRRGPGIAHVEALGQPHISAAGLLGVMTTWPTFNHHTDFTIVMSPTNASQYQTLVWPSGSV